MNVYEQIESIETKRDLVKFIDILEKDFKTNSDSWENVTLETYLQALGAWINDMDGYFNNINEPAPDAPTWKLIGIMLLAASRYE